MSLNLDVLARIGMAGAIVDTYESKTHHATKEINMLLVQLRLATERAIELFNRVSLRELNRVGNKIDKMFDKTMLGKPRSIITLIEFVLAIIDEPAKKCNAERKAAIHNIAQILLALRKEIGGERDYPLSSAAAARAADVWDGVEI